MDGLELKLKRVRAGLMQADLGLLVGLNAGRISEMEKGRRPVSDAVIEALDRKLAESVRTGP